MDTSESSSAIAIIGMGCRYPGGADSPEDLWKLVASGRDTWSEVPKDRFNAQAFYHPDPEAPETVGQDGGHFLDQTLAKFDPGFFNISAPEAEAVDPLQRVVLETTWEAVENSCIPMEKFRGSDTAVYMAMFGHDAEQLAHKDPLDFNGYHYYGITRTLLANRLSYLFDLHGPSVMLDTACSGSLVAIHLACQALRLGEATIAIAGGGSLIFSPDQMALMSLVGAFNSDGRSYTWDERGNGYGRGEGVGVVVNAYYPGQLKRLEDALADGDPIRAVIRSSVVNQDGKTNGISLPSQTAQQLLARRVFSSLPFSHQDVQYAEVHGTGTKAGDKIEMEAIRSVLASGRDAHNPLYVGAIKSNIGHSEAASGAAGLIKTVMAMEKEQIAPQALLNKFKPGLDPDGYNIVIPRIMTPWPAKDGYRRAVVSSLGFGGTNCMLVLESAAVQEETLPSNNGTLNGKGTSNGLGAPEASGRSRLFVISAKSEYSATKAIERLKMYLERHISVDIDALSYTLAKRRTHFPWRFAATAHDTVSLIQTLAAQDVVPQKSITGKNLTVFVFTGQGAQWAQMGHELLAVSPVFRKSIQDSEEFLRRQLGADWNLVEELSRGESSTRLHDSRIGQPASTAVQIALVDLLRSWGIVPAAVLGHSSGEIAAAYAAGALTSGAALRVSYFRGPLAGLSRKRVTGSGAMVAVGLGEKGVAKYLDGHKGLVNACINSPSSVTISGDEKEIQEMEVALQKDQVFYRRLKVDTAYHSHHMKSVAQDYLDKLQGLDSSSTSPTTRFFSTVTEQEKHQHFGPSYWVSNLVSPVRFAGTLQTMMHELGSCGQGVVNMVEVGPHKTLAGPIRQTLQQEQQTDHESSYTYIATLERGKTCVASLLATGSRLYMAGVEGLDPSIVTSLGIERSEPSPRLLTNLPRYAWDHRVQYWYESRLSREHRFRRHPYHDLLGSLVVASPETQPSWRMLLSHQRLPWLKDHMVDDVAVFPAAGYMTMAIQALVQVHHSSSSPARGYTLKHITFQRALFLPKDARNVEVILTFRRLDNDSYDFVISSCSSQDKWYDHCTGNISRREDEAFGDAAEQQKSVSHFEDAKDACVDSLDERALYSHLATLGNYYGPSFSVSKGGRRAAFQAVNTVEIPDIASTTPARFIEPHIIHPTTLDGMLQTALLVYVQHAQPGSLMPTYIAEVCISTDVASEPGQQLDVVCDLSDTFPRSTNFDISAFQRTQTRTADGVNPGLRCVLSISGGEAVVVGDAKAAPIAESEREREAREQRKFIWTSQWGLDIGSVTAEMLESAVVPLQSDEAGMTQWEKVDLLDAVSTMYISMAIHEIESNLGGADAIAKDFRQHQWKSFRSLNPKVSAYWERHMRQTPKTYAGLAQLAAKLGAEGEAMERIGSNLVQILTGQTDALGLLLENQLLFRIYHGDEGARASQYMADCVAHLIFQQPGLRILEVGAGTGGTTARVLRACQSRMNSTAPFFAEYMFTDVSSGFFGEVQSGLLKPWAHMLSFQAFDLERDPIEQGFEAHAYDLIIAANVVHATKSIRESLRRIRKLLKPSGILGLVELTRSPTSVSMIFGCLEGWWAGIQEGRTDGPIQNKEQWDSHLRASGFSGVDLAAYDLPEPQRHSALLLSTARPELVADDFDADNKRRRLDEYDGEIPPIEVLSALLETSTNAEFVEGLALELIKIRQGSVTMGSWSDSVINDECSYIILDSAESRLVTNATAEQFSRITSLLSGATKLYWVTLAGTGGKEKSGDGLLVRPDNALVTGLVRVARAENNKLQCFTLDVQDNMTTSQSLVRKCIIELIQKSEARMAFGVPLEFEFSLRDGLMRIQRLVAAPCLQRLVSDDSEEGDNDTNREMIPFFGTDKLRLEVQKPGLLGSLAFVVVEQEQEQGPEPESGLGPYEVEIKPQAWGVNFKDVLIALGQLHPRQTMVGEVAGIVVRVGSKASEMFQLQPGHRVAACATYPNYYSNLTRTDARFLHRLPESMTWVEAASLPVAYATASYSLVDCARLEPGMTVLVHAASGALGQAAAEIAVKAGATVFATAGTPEKRQLVEERFGIPKSRIFSSRTADFARGIKHVTGGRGVDVVLNSLAGPLLAASWECVADLGTFIELGKVDIWKRRQISMEPFDRGVRFISVDMGVLYKRQPQVFQRVLQRVFGDITAGRVRPLPPATTFPIGDIEMAFRYMQAGKHTGKIVLQADQDTMVAVSRNRQQRRPPPPRLFGDATYIISGGLGAVGKSLCFHLQILGARYITLLSRRQFSDEERSAQEKALTSTETPGSIVKIMTCDVSDQHAVRRASLEIQNGHLPPVKGVIQGALVLSDRTLNQLTQADMDAVLAPRYRGTQNLWSTFAVPQPLDFFLLLSSMSGIIGSLGQANYAATTTYQDMFSHAVALTAASDKSGSVSTTDTQPAPKTKTTNVVSLDLPLINNTQDITREHVESLRRQGGLCVDMEDAFTVIDYAISGRAVNDGCHQISFGIHPELVRAVPLLSHTIFEYKMQQQQQASNSTGGGEEGTHSKKMKQSIDKAISAATSPADAEALILATLREKVSSLTAVGGQLDLDIPVADMGLDSLIATELKNWIFNTLSARVQNVDIIDAPSLRVLAAQVAQVSTLINRNSSKAIDETSDIQEKKENRKGDKTEEAISRSDDDDESGSDLNNSASTSRPIPIIKTNGEHALPKYPVQPLEQVLDNFIEAVSHIGTPEELEQTRRAITAFLDPRGMGQVMQMRLEQSSASTSGIHDSIHTPTGAAQGDVVEMYVRSKWLRTRSWRPRLRNFFGTIPGTIPSDSKPGRSQVNRAATLALAAFHYKLALDQGNVQQDYQHDQPLSMETVHWIFNAHRTPAIGCDRMDRWPGNDHIVVMRRGHVFKVPLRNSEDSTVLTTVQLAAIFDGILAHPTPTEVNSVCLFTTAHRDEWATVRHQLIATSRENADALDCIEKSLFIVYLEDASPSAPSERAEVFLLDDNSNRWLDKTMGLIVCVNGVAAAFLEHTMVDGTTFEGLAKAFTEYDDRDKNGNGQLKTLLTQDDISPTTNDPGFRHLPLVLPDSLAKRVVTLRAEHVAAHDGYQLANYDLTRYGTRWLRECRLPPKSVIQVLVQLAVRLVLGANPSAVDVVSQRPFQGGRTDMIFTSIPEITAFCERAAATAAKGATTQVHGGDEDKVLVSLFKEAVRAHAKLITLAQRGRSWRWHLAALSETLKHGDNDDEDEEKEELPELYRDPIYLRMGERSVATSFTEFGVPEMGRCPPRREDVWFGIEAFEERVHFTVINGRSHDFVENLAVAAETIRGIITRLGQV